MASAETSENFLAVTSASLVGNSGPTLFEQVFELFKQQILSGELKPGDSLLPERELCKKLGVSRATLREALRALSLLGLIEIRPGQSAYVRAQNVDVLKDLFSLLLGLSPAVYDEILDVRLALEIHAIKAACQKATMQDLARLRTELANIEGTAYKPAEGAEADYRFHLCIVEASHNNALIAIHMGIASLLRRSHHERRHSVQHDPKTLSALGLAHRILYRAIAARQPEEAAAAMQEHFLLGDRRRAAPPSDEPQGENTP
jgi:DNA-binding FadR family transcriptional regulator